MIQCFHNRLHPLNGKNVNVSDSIQLKIPVDNLPTILRDDRYKYGKVHISSWRPLPLHNSVSPSVRGVQI